MLPASVQESLAQAKEVLLGVREQVTEKVVAALGEASIRMEPWQPLLDSLQVLGWRAFHYGFIPLVILLGYNSSPKLSMMDLVSPMQLRSATEREIGNVYTAACNCSWIRASWRVVMPTEITSSCRGRRRRTSP